MALLMALTIWRGGPEERGAANALLIAWLFSKILYRYQGLQTEWGILVVDTALLAFLMWIALRSRRYWPLFAAGFYLLAVVTHLAEIVNPAVGGWAYITAGIMWSYLLAFAIAYGALTRPRADGAERA